MFGRGSRFGAARLLGAAAGLVASTPGAVFAQVGATSRATLLDTEPAELDPNAPLAPMPDIGVAWPELERERCSAGADRSHRRDGQKGKPRGSSRKAGNDPLHGGDRGTSDPRRLRGPAARLSQAIGARSRAQGSGQCGADRTPGSAPTPTSSTQLLRSQGYYDAEVEARTETSWRRAARDPQRAPGQQYRFASVELPGLDAAGPVASKLRDAFAVKSGDPVIAADVIAGGLALTQASARKASPSAKIGDQDIEVNHQTHLASLRLPVDPGPLRASALSK